MLERFEGTDGLAAIFPAMLNSFIALKALGYADDHPQVKRAELELKKLEHEDGEQRPHRTVFLAGVGYGDCGDRIARIGSAEQPSSFGKMLRLDHGARNSFSRRLVLQESGGRRTKRLGFRV